MSPNYQDCPNWNNSAEIQGAVTGKKSGFEGTIIPWSGMELVPDKINVVTHRSTPIIIGLIGAANAGKTSYLGMLYTLLFNGGKFNAWNFAGSYTLIAWEAQAKGLKIGANGKVTFPKATPSTPDYYSLYHLALKTYARLYDVIFADSSGEVFTKWAADTDDTEAENAKWIYENSDGFIFFVDCEALIEGRGRVKRTITQLAGQISSALEGRSIVVVWSKADKIDAITPTIKSAVEEVLTENFPEAPTYYISNFSEDSEDVLCYINNLAAAEELLNQLVKRKPLELVPNVPFSNDFFLNYHGQKYSK